ncbi:hypothetical protein DICPUDRAFT_149841 [Dictyostelium purpureum]|uniref:Uncharacterized protein n=1 Tax=Dictyostelium purpureum TaxID=5786 RepID=F0ZES9_DICPU|nr:uncharacterized protein DICPUDRAFT_149841 [Dictyostelium purpureum]EGC37525.1 hypothetical protein DICPUDRAFT_149841 [Dictyostelium purpureum]|eukprot:XP_003285916.1 hypothetical protein DICPUDRAFT_149841 [Dictyostelium purpureum]
MDNNQDSNILRLVVSSVSINLIHCLNNKYDKNKEKILQRQQDPSVQSEY